MVNLSGTKEKPQKAESLGKKRIIGIMLWVIYQNN